MIITNKYGRITLINDDNKQIAVIQSTLSKCQDGTIMSQFINKFFDNKNKYQNIFKPGQITSFLELYKEAEHEYAKRFSSNIAPNEILWLNKSI